MQQILDIHTHHPAPAPDAVISVAPADFHPMEGQLYSIGIHPWRTTGEITDEEWQLFEETCRHQQVVAIGECGIDIMKGGPLFRQMLVMKKQISLSEEIGKPLVIHNVRAHDIIIGLKKDLKPLMPWMVHGFRGKPTVAKMLTDAGMFISFGPLHNDTSVGTVPEELLLAETDECDVAIAAVLTNLSALRGSDITDTVAANSRRFLGRE